MTKIYLYIITLLLLLSLAACSDDNNENNPPGPTEPSDLTLQEIKTGLSSPVFVTFAPGDSTRLFIVEQTGRILVHHIEEDSTSVFLDISGPVDYGGEKGLLGMAFHPDYQNNGYFYVNYTTVTTQLYTHVTRFTVSADPDVADVASETLILEQSQPYSNHNCGMLAFGPDGYLYVGFGDGGSGGDPEDRAQNLTTWLGKMLRIDVDSGTPYAIPDDNPFVGQTSALDEIWAYGLRNPWRYSFDRQTGDFWIADVGQYEIEEIDFQPASSNGGENYGWRLKEGTACYNPSTNCEDGVTLVDPIYDYRHDDGVSKCSVTGGYVYRGDVLNGYDGAYFFGDYCSGQVWSMVYDGNDVTIVEHPALNTNSLSSFGEDYHGELYVMSLSRGVLYKIVPDSM